MKNKYLALILVFMFMISFSFGSKYLGESNIDNTFRLNVFDDDIFNSDLFVLNSAQLSPQKVMPGHTLYIKVNISSLNGIDKIIAYIDDVDQIELNLESGTIYSGIFKGSWLVHSTEEKKYPVVLNITDKKGNVATDYSLSFVDPVYVVKTGNNGQCVCVISNDDTLYCKGDCFNFFNPSPSIFDKIDSSVSDVCISRQISPNTGHMCYIRSNGYYRCIGHNYYGQLGCSHGYYQSNYQTVCDGTLPSPGDIKIACSPLHTITNRYSWGYPPGRWEYGYSNYYLVTATGYDFVDVVTNIGTSFGLESDGSVVSKGDYSISPLASVDSIGGKYDTFCYSSGANLNTKVTTGNFIQSSYADDISAIACGNVGDSLAIFNSGDVRISGSSNNVVNLTNAFQGSVENGYYVITDSGTVKKINTVGSDDVANDLAFKENANVLAGNSTDWKFYTNLPFGKKIMKDPFSYDQGQSWSWEYPVDGTYYTRVGSATSWDYSSIFVG